MATDNTQLNLATTIGDVIRTVLRGLTTKTQVMLLDVGGEGSEVFCNGVVPVTFSSPATQSIRVSYSSAQNNAVIVAPAGGQILTVTRITVTTDNDNTGKLTFKIGCATAVTPTGVGCALSHPGVGNNAFMTVGDGSGTIVKSAVAGDPLLITCSNPNGTFDVNVTYSAA